MKTIKEKIDKYKKKNRLRLFGMNDLTLHAIFILLLDTSNAIFCRNLSGSCRRRPYVSSYHVLRRRIVPEVCARPRTSTVLTGCPREALGRQQKRKNQSLRRWLSQSDRGFQEPVTRARNPKLPAEVAGARSRRRTVTLWRHRRETVRCTRCLTTPAQVGF